MLCDVREDRNESKLRLLPATEDMGILLADALGEHGIDFQRRRNLFEVIGREEPGRVIALLRHVLSGPEREALSVLCGDSSSVELGFATPQPLDHWWQVHRTSWFDDALMNKRFEVWFQPIFDTSVVDTSRESGGSRILGHECLIRLKAGRLYSGGEILDAARVRNTTRAFDSHARALAIHSGAREVREGKLFINFLASSIYNPEFCMKSTMAALPECGMKPENIVFEIVESGRVPDPAHLRCICDYFRRQGFAFALDNVGPGADSLRMVCDLRPDFIKLDKSLVAGVENPLHAAAIGKLVELAGRLGVTVIAGGVEHMRTMENLWLLGVQCMQGYFFGRPAPRWWSETQTARAFSVSVQDLALCQ